MRNRVMDVQQIQLVAIGDIRHPRSQRQAIGRVLKQRVIRDLYFVVVDAENRRIQTNWIGIGDEVNVVATIPLPPYVG